MLVCALSFVPRTPPSATDFDPVGVRGGPLFAPPSTSPRVQSRFEVVELGHGMCSSCHRRHWDYRLVPAGTTHNILEHSIYVRVYLVCTGTRGSLVDYVWIYECVRTLCDVRMAYLREYMHLFGDEFWWVFALVYSLHYFIVNIDVFILLHLPPLRTHTPTVIRGFCADAHGLTKK